eukprot:CAMPEP_0178422464 /NCGR_PEP_ID=MMETSP0689_2-20121128/27189_1 /TAXON_ID=160604 /ORGANISM="Amphidinium massartii, Strain CS-259" /LENGTH=250 /DNA_ID=CAMNT_0020044033 /DNA_START=27 /DNA_END=775 /DNA_ORIENTATION=+
MEMTSLREQNLFLAKLAEQAERYDEMAMLMAEATRGGGNLLLTVDERNLLSVAFKNAVGSRRAACRIVRSIQSAEEAKGNHREATFACEYCRTIAEEAQSLCHTALTTLTQLQSAHDDAATSKENLDGIIFLHKMEGDYHRYLAEMLDGDQQAQAAAASRGAYQKAQEMVKLLPPTSPVRLGMLLSYSVFQYEVLQNHEDAYKMAKEAFDEALTDLENVPEEEYKEATLLMQLLRDNLTLWSSEEDSTTA